MHLTETLSLPVSAAAAGAMYADPDYAEVRRETMGARTASARVDGDAAGAFTTTTELTMPTDRVPDMMRRFVGQTVTVRETQRWQASGPDGARDGEISFEIVGAPASMTGRTRLAPAGEDASTITIDGELVAKVPLLGRRIEQAAIPYVSEVLGLESTSAAAYARSRR
ncbi:DUF2505 domain-containing protein [Brachybacterium huguangmaarense]